MALSLDMLYERREAARLRNWSYQQDVARTCNKKCQNQDHPERGLCSTTSRKKQRGNSPPSGKDPIRSSRCGEHAPTGCKITKGSIKILLLQTWKAVKPGTWVITPTPAL
ncbi:hypothetical protein DY000_02020527 [Brassica cretica]|uniref:Uncharacterized protein n=1 Tax=Brassica cretica TaxID=69181 RepID=A0ABQ7E3J5_BRACR|nr:hypothetical protein DY000_02020527 [Brassica cretica]